MDDKGNIPLPPSIYFGGCCFGAAFYVGVYKAMVELWGEDFYKKINISGGSAGTIFAVGIALGKSPEALDSLYRKVAENTNKYGPVYYASRFMTEGLRDLLDDPKAHRILEGRCMIGTTSCFATHRWHLAWEDNEDLIECIRASFHIPFYCEKIDALKGVPVVDGAYGFAGEDLPHGDETLYVGIDPHAEITRHFTNGEMFFPAVGEAYDAMVQSGYEAMMNWDGRMNKKVGHRLPNYQALYVLWFLKFWEILVFGVYAFICMFLGWVLTVLKLPFTLLVRGGDEFSKPIKIASSQYHQSMSSSTTNKHSVPALMQKEEAILLN